jgi:NTE family protein
MVWKSVSATTLRKKNFSLILSGGVAHGIAHVGVIKFLEENHLVPNEILGTSMGALVGALYSIGKNTTEMAQFLKEADNIKLFKAKIHWGSIEYIVLEGFLKKIFGDLKMKDTKIELKIMATDIDTGEGKLFTKEDDVLVLDAVRASISLPGIFEFKKIKNKYYMDGGVFSNLPIEHAKKLNIKIASNVINKSLKLNYEEDSLLKKLTSSFNIYYHLVYYLMENQTYSKTKYIKDLIMIEPDLSGQKRYSLKDYQKSIEIGYKATKKAIRLPKTQVTAPTLALTSSG